tara:strand:- start:866 stop:1249 length:384 start_codon:yes stop_codon:yes gene_type:complete
MRKGEMKNLLWLDDVRDPYENDGDWLVFSPISRPYNVVWVKTYQEFVEWIQENGIPDGICFDHDLGWDEHDTETPSGFDCAKWLVDYCLDNNTDFPKYNIQSANPVGKDNINGIIQSFRKFKDREDV